MRFVIDTAERLFLAAIFLLSGGGADFCAIAQEPTAMQFLDQAQYSLQRGEWAAAIPFLEKALAIEPRHKGARSALITTLMRLNRFAEAEKNATLFAEQFPSETEPVFLRAMIAFQEGQIARVSELTGQCLKRGDDRAEVHKLFAIAEYLLGRPENFETHIRAAIKQNPRDADAHYHLGRYFFEIKRYNEALDSFQAALKLHPNHYKAHYYAGLVYQGQNEMERAKEAFHAAIEIIDRQRIRYAWPYTDLGERLINDGEFDRGVGWHYRAVRNDPSSPHAWYGYAKGLFQKDSSPEVKEALMRAITLDPGYSEAYYLLARYYKKTGEEQLAKETFAKFEEIKKNPPPSPYGVRRW